MAYKAAQVVLITVSLAPLPQFVYPAHPHALSLAITAPVIQVTTMWVYPLVNHVNTPAIHAQTVVHVLHAI